MPQKEHHDSESRATIRLVRRCLLMGDDPVTGNNYDHRKNWVEAMMAIQAKYFAIDLLGFSIMSNHFHQILRSRPDAVLTWDDTEVARRWLPALLLDQLPQAEAPNDTQRPDRFLAPLTIDELRDEIGAHLNISGERCSDKGFLNMSIKSYIELLDWTARHIVPGKRGSTPGEVPAILQRLGLEPTAWCELVLNFGELFSTVAGRPTVIDSARSHRHQRRFHITPRLRQLLGS